MIPEIIAHRGASAHAPENTLAAFQRAIDDGADGIEFDVRLTRDGDAVVFHDRTLKRTAGFDAEIIESIPTLAAALDFLSEFQGSIYIELKGKERDIGRLTDRVAVCLNEREIVGRVVVKSFKLSVIPRIKLLCPGIRTAALFAPKIRNILRKEKYLVKIAEELGADEISVHFSLATRKLMRKAERRGMSVVIWTADHPRWVKRATKLGIKAIITNDPGRLIAARDLLHP
jgi:glycerophosphoryl diester phosphodiesterase